MNNQQRIINFIKSKQGRIVVSIIWGLGIACLFRKVCEGRDCLIYRAPVRAKVAETTYRRDSKCYKFVPESATCAADAIV